MKALEQNDYYILNDTSMGEPLYIHKVKNAPAFFRGCFDYCYSNKLATVYKDMFSNWALLVLFSDDIANAFLDWAVTNFDLLNSPLLSTELEWSKYEEEYVKQGFKLIVLRGELDVYCLMRYLKTCFNEEPCWNDVYSKMELEFAGLLV